MIALMLLTSLLFTVPDRSQDRWVVPADGADSVHVECQGSNPAIVDSVRLMIVPASGGWARLAQIHSAWGKEGRLDSFVVDGNVTAHYYVQASAPGLPDSMKWGCASNYIFIPGTTTGVPIPEPIPKGSVRYCYLVDVQGRRIWKPAHHGIYWQISVYWSGRWEAKRVQY